MMMMMMGWTNLGEWVGWTDGQTDRLAAEKPKGMPIRQFIWSQVDTPKYYVWGWGQSNRPHYIVFIYYWFPVYTIYVSSHLLGRDQIGPTWPHHWCGLGIYTICTTWLGILVQFFVFSVVGKKIRSQNMIPFQIQQGYFHEQAGYFKTLPEYLGYLLRMTWVLK